ncbi:hypothetical protein F0562_028490 [Nyssa sinensis]|uniref:Autophagy-related protein 2 n=1 Tax=Nyssa sinensis TaxID=561372 RepID=A0A5J5B2F4_9ASTE|nr:hypothetical protein F0562_028490 [Nyssa sinensis]
MGLSRNALSSFSSELRYRLRSSSFTSGVELQLKHVHAFGVYGWSSVCETIVGVWLEDISQNQIHKLLQGLPPIRSLAAVGSGAGKLVSLPVKNYRKDHRLLKGMQRARRAHAPRARTAVRGQSDKVTRQLDVRLRSPENGLRRPATTVRPSDTGVQLRQEVDASTAAGLNFKSSLNSSRSVRRNIPDLRKKKGSTSRWGFKGHQYTNSIGPHRLGHYQGLSYNSNDGPHGLGQFKKRWVTLKDKGQTNIQEIISKGPDEGSHSLAQRHGEIKGAQTASTEPSSGQLFAHGIHNIQPSVSDYRGLSQECFSV